MSERRTPINITRESPHYHRLKYYSAIKSGLKHMSRSTTYMDVPTHVVEENAFVVFQGPAQDGNVKKHSSISTIFSVWNTMVGSSLLTIPWAFSNSGIVLGIFISFITFIIAFYTCNLYIKLAGNDTDFADTVYKYFGKYGWIITMLFSNLLMFAVVVIYYELMSQALFPIIAAIIEWIWKNEVDLDTNLRLNSFSLFYTCIGLTIILFPVISKKDISLFIKLNSFGVLFVCIILLFILSYGFYSFGNTNFKISNEKNDFSSKERNISLFRSSFNSLAGMMTLGYYLHNIALSITKENANPKNNTRDVFLGYFMVFLSYSLVGTLGYLGFSGYKFDKDIRETQNLLLMFEATYVPAFLVRITCFLQMFSVYPMLFCITRNQFQSIIYKGREMTKTASLIFNATIILLATIIGATFPQVGSILGYVGGFIGLGLIYVIPIAVYLKRYKINLENPRLVHALDNNLVKTASDEDGLTSPKIAVPYKSKGSDLNKSYSEVSNFNEDITERASLLSRSNSDLSYVNYNGYYLT